VLELLYENFLFQRYEDELLRILILMYNTVLGIFVSSYHPHSQTQEDKTRKEYFKRGDALM